MRYLEGGDLENCGSWLCLFRCLGCSCRLKKEEWKYINIKWVFNTGGNITGPCHTPDREIRLREMFYHPDGNTRIFYSKEQQRERKAPNLEVMAEGHLSEWHTFYEKCFSMPDRSRKRWLKPYSDEERHRMFTANCTNIYFICASTPVRLLHCNNVRYICFQQNSDIICTNFAFCEASNER